MRRAVLSFSLCSLVLMVAFAALTSPALAKPQSPGTAAYAAHSCKGNAYREVKGTGGETFANTGQCVSYVARGGTLVPLNFTPPSTASVVLSAREGSVNGQCIPVVNVYGFPEGGPNLVEIVDAITGTVVSTYNIYSGADGRGTQESSVRVDPGDNYYARVYPNSGTTFVQSDTVTITC